VAPWKYRTEPGELSCGFWSRQGAELVLLVPLRGTPVLDTSSPNKFFESLAAGVPVIQNTQGWMKDFLSEHQVGFTLDPNDPVQLAEKLIELDSQQPELEEMGKKAHLLAAKVFDKDYLAQKMLTGIIEATT
jgi:glycosyltransferase involved in cell wall biosynthesis